jgi:MFS family permease
VATRSRSYLAYLAIFLGSVAIMDGYVSSIKSSAIPYILSAYGIDAPTFSALESLVLIPTFFIVAFNSLADRIGRRWGLLLLVLGMGLPCLAILLWTPTLPWFLAFYAAATFFTVSNLWHVPANEEAPATVRARYVAVIYAVGQMPLIALLPPLLVERLGLDWRWMYGIMFLAMLPLLVLWLPMRDTGRYRAVAAERQLNPGQRWRPFGLGAIDRSDLRYIALTAAIVACLLVFMVLYFWAGYFFMTLRGYTLVEWSRIVLVMLTMVLLGGLTGGWVLDFIGRTRELVLGCLGITLCVIGTGFLPGQGPAVALILAAFFIGLVSAWTTTYVPEVFPTDRRASCAGWVSSIARVAYVLGPALAAVLLKAFPTMTGFWVAAGLVMLIPIAIIWLADPFETKTRSLEEIERER